MSLVKKATRREFLAAGTSAVFSAATSVVPAQADASDSNLSAPGVESTFHTYVDLFENTPQRTLSGDEATQVAMPVGGIGAGSS
jgi:hypothetical protein